MCWQERPSWNDRRSVERQTAAAERRVGPWVTVARVLLNLDEFVTRE